MGFDKRYTYAIGEAGGIRPLSSLVSDPHRSGGKGDRSPQNHRCPALRIGEATSASRSRSEKENGHQIYDLVKCDVGQVLLGFVLTFE